MRTLVWRGINGKLHTVTVRGRRCARRVTLRRELLGTLDDFMEEQRTRVARKLQERYVRVSLDGMTSRQIRQETIITRRA